MKKATLAIVVALCLMILFSATTMAAPRVGLKHFGLDLGVAGINPHGGWEVLFPNSYGIGGFIDANLALTGGFVLRASWQRTFGDLGGISLAEATMQFDLSPYGAIYAGALYFGGHNVFLPNSYVFPQVGLVLRLPVGDTLALYGVVSAHWEFPDQKVVPGYGLYLTLNFGKGFGLCAGARGFGSELTASPWITTGVSYSF